MNSVRSRLRALAVVPWPVRIEGPPGSGKTIAARYLHEHSNRSAGPFVSCALTMLADGLEIEELTGHARGAFTGAVRDHAGAFEAAHRGTLFLDEIAVATPAAQRALLQLVEDGDVRRLGERRVRPIDARLVFATNANLEELAESGQFRRDLLHRLGALVVQMPGLKEHPEDIPGLAHHILEKKRDEIDGDAPPLTPGAVRVLKAYNWPGNVRELEKVIEHWIVFGVLPDAVSGGTRTWDWRVRLDEALARHKGKKAPAARELGISRKTLYEELKRRDRSCA